MTKQIASTFNLNLNKHRKFNSETEFAFYLAGLVDADGYFTKTGALSLSFHNHDLPVALTLQAFIGGHVYKYKKQRAISLTFTKKTSKSFTVYCMINYN